MPHYELYQACPRISPGMKNFHQGIAALRARHQQRSGLLQDWITEADRQQHYPHHVLLHGLCRAVLGNDLFCVVYRRSVALAVDLAPCRFLHEALHHAGERTGYRFLFVDQDTADRFRAAASNLMARAGSA